MAKGKRNASRFKDGKEIQAWVDYEYDCEKKGIKPMPKRDWLVMRRGSMRNKY